MKTLFQFKKYKTKLDKRNFSIISYYKIFFLLFYLYINKFFLIIQKFFYN